MLDLLNWEVIGWSVTPCMPAYRSTNALTMARLRSRAAPGALYLSDDSQSSSHEFRRKLKAYGMRCPMSRKSCWENASTECVFSSQRNERVHGTTYYTHREPVAYLFDYIEVFYNRTRRHSSLGFLSPIRFMRDWLAAQ